MFDFFVMTIFIQLIICLLQFFGEFVYEKTNLFGLGLWSMVFIYMSRAMYEDPEAERPFCCLPCNIQSKYYPIGILLIFSVIGGVRAGDVIGFCQGLLEYLMFNKVLIRYPLSWINKLDGCTPMFLRKRSDYKSSSNCQTNLLSVCRGEALQNN